MVFNFSGNIIMVNETPQESQSNTLQLKGLINAYGRYLTNIHFEYGLTESFGSSVSGTPNFVYGYNTNLITAAVNNTLPNQTYYYRLVATYNGTTIYSPTYQYTTFALGLAGINSETALSVFPNPATDFVNFKSNNSEKINGIEFYNALGQRIYNKTSFNDTDVKVDVSNFSKGIYFIKVKLENTGVVSSKLILK
ncbi:T9SS type A sorting domain-containing protein [Flavobacterium sp. 3HN19-14]|uniref:T9SS type A sorting domain-containing protein n=1 Tax=Flavobacterium sp. 3HN19-14 TaxID=3448133 RepID=UPI003EDF5048